ncbi:MAG: protein phosphatase 2C domain-containing protein [Gemmatimonadota bacterium]|nr:protein phosphatase 2C domain-containing protein [Gemmatimonadota bacterium]
MIHETPTGGIPRKPRDSELDVFGVTNVGKVRADNQDHFLIASLHKRLAIHHTSIPLSSLSSSDTDRLAFLAMVADGVGGSAGGEEASRFALDAITAYITRSMHCYYTADPHDDAEFVHVLQEGAMRVHSRLTQRATEKERAGMATTLTAFLGVWPRAYILQVGDSRYYTLRNGTLHQVSRDQTVAEDLIAAGVIRRSDPGHERWKHVLSSAIGGPEASPVITAVENDWHHVHLLCSDGLTKHVSDEQIAHRLRTMTSSHAACQALLQDALDGGGTDNITVIVGRAVPAEA